MAESVAARRSYIHLPPVISQCPCILRALILREGGERERITSMDDLRSICRRFWRAGTMSGRRRREYSRKTNHHHTRI